MKLKNNAKMATLTMSILLIISMTLFAKNGMVDIPKVFMGFDSLNVSFVGNYPFGTSKSVAYDSTRNLIFLGSGGGVYILDGSNPNNPLKISEKIHTRGRAAELFLDETSQKLYIADGMGGIEIWDVQSPTDPFKLGACFPPSRDIIDMWVQGSYAYMVDMNSLIIVDVSDPSNPSFVSSYTPSIPQADRVHVSGNYAYIISRNSANVFIIDISDPSNPYEVCHYYPYNWMHDVYVQGSYAYLGGPEGLHILDVSNPSSPSEVGYLYLSHARRIQVVGTYAYIASSSTSNQRFHIVDVSDPSNPQQVGMCYLPDVPENIYVSNNKAYIASDQFGLCIIDISDPSNPHQIGFYSKIPKFSYGVKARSSLVYLANHELSIIDISDISNPKEVGFYDCSGTLIDVDVSGSYAYTIDHSPACMRIIDVSDPSNPYELSSTYLSASWVSKIAVSGNYAYVGTIGPGKLYIIDVSDPSNPQIISFYDPPSIQSVTGVYIQNPYAYITCDSMDLYVLDIRDPSTPTKIGEWKNNINNFADPWDIYVKDSFAYLAEGVFDILFIVDISNPYNPTESASYSFPVGHYPRGVYVSEDYAFVALSGPENPDNVLGIYILDVSDPSNPTEAGYYIGMASFEIYVDHSYIYTASHDRGLQIYSNLLQINENHNTSGNSYPKTVSFIKNNPLRFCLPYSGNWEISVFNTAGGRVYFASKYFDKGTQKIPLNFLNTGLYFYELKNRNFYKTGKLILIK